MEGGNEGCWNYLKGNGTALPAIGVRIKGALGSVPQKGEKLIKVDTGYDGFLLLGEEDYKRAGLHLSETPREQWPVGWTIAGESFKLRRAMAIVQMPKMDVKLEGYIDTFQGNREGLIGLGFLREFELLLKGPSERACIV